MYRYIENRTPRRKQAAIAMQMTDVCIVDFLRDDPDHIGTKVARWWLVRLADRNVPSERDGESKHGTHTCRDLAVKQTGKQQDEKYRG
ncbi:hypothetical protein TNIN_429151 [Trichonephila inaurata madagascariensis]|uniref:Uncharacterized protein n=1 Tax=Trichonephila inaurata madagascariensis TaxID=2747483 RepID=A0A8X6YLE0_9ARAC|nr:hypothetical protein TNIN_429151 [Trichonephila inaurata madagascariensis]